MSETPPFATRWPTWPKRQALDEERERVVERVRKVIMDLPPDCFPALQLSRALVRLGQLEMTPHREFCEGGSEYEGRSGR